MTDPGRKAKKTILCWDQEPVRLQGCARNRLPGQSIGNEMFLFFLSPQAPPLRFMSKFSSYQPTANKSIPHEKDHFGNPARRRNSALILRLRRIPFLSIGSQPIFRRGRLRQGYLDDGGAVEEVNQPTSRNF